MSWQSWKRFQPRTAGQSVSCPDSGANGDGDIHRIPHRLALGDCASDCRVDSPLFTNCSAGRAPEVRRMDRRPTDPLSGTKTNFDSGTRNHITPEKRDHRASTVRFRQPLLPEHCSTLCSIYSKLRNAVTGRKLWTVSAAANAGRTDSFSRVATHGQRAETGSLLKNGTIAAELRTPHGFCGQNNRGGGRQTPRRCLF